jgi:predicted  nucleic acid-binding Zn-ribbon protein
VNVCIFVVNRKSFFADRGMQNITQTLLPGISPFGTGPVVISFNGVAVGTISPQESALYQTLFRTALGPKLVQTSSTIPGDTAAKFLQRSGLSKKQLHDIWEIADPSNSGILDSDGFYRACRLVAHGQSGQLNITPDLLSVEPESLPSFEGVSDLSDSTVWRISEAEIARYREVFHRESGGNPKIDGSDARALLVKSGLSSSELCDVWDISDVDKDGKLTFGEFVVVMHLVSKLRDGSIGFIPSELPQGLREYLKLSPNQGGSAVRILDPMPDEDIRPEESVSPKSHRVPEFPSSRAEFLTPSSLAQLDRARDFNRQAASERSRLETLREEARRMEQALVAADHEVGLLQDQILGLKSYIAEAEEEMDEFRRESGVVVDSVGGDVSRAVAAVRESVAEDEREILELRAKLERIGREKTDLQSAVQVLGEKKRQAEQDRNLMIIGLESDRSKLVTVRADRLKLWEQRAELTKELTNKTFENLSSVRPNAPIVRRDRKGVKADSLDAKAVTDPLAGAFGNSTAELFVPHFGSQV